MELAFISMALLPLAVCHWQFARLLPVGRVTVLRVSAAPMPHVTECALVVGMAT
jgi:hypothetical protein